MRLLLLMIAACGFIFCAKSASDPGANIQGTWSLEKISIVFAEKKYDFAVGKGNVIITEDKIQFQTSGVPREWTYTMSKDNRFLELLSHDNRKMSYEIIDNEESTLTLSVLSFPVDGSDLDEHEKAALSMLNMELLRNGEDLETLSMQNKKIEVIFDLKRK